ncbi:MAG TPA: PTS sugar transporter subunit IIA [Tissierellales bacterium]|nr:PTS sugar transporter subunit IIA [Tissierellales bacterium]
MSFKFVPELIVKNISANNSTEVIELLGKQLSENGFVDGSYIKSVLEREEEFPTGLQAKKAAIAIPHALNRNVKKSGICLGILENKVPFRSMEDINSIVEVEFVFLLAIKESNRQLKILKAIMEMLQNEVLFNKIRAEKDKKIICDILNEFIKE